VVARKAEYRHPRLALRGITPYTPAMLRGIIFDFDGVLVDSEPLHYRAFLRLGQTLGIEFTYREYLDKYIGFDDRDAFRELIADRLPAGALGGTAEIEAAVSRLVAQKGDVFEAIVREGVEAYPGVVALVKQAAAEMPIAIASGATRRDIDLILGRLGLAGTFDPIVTADDVKRSKPPPETYALAARAIARKLPGDGGAFEPSQLLAIEDTPDGIDSARGAGLSTLGVTTTMRASDLHRASRVVEKLEGVTLDELRAWFG